MTFKQVERKQALICEVNYSDSHESPQVATCHRASSAGTVTHTGEQTDHCACVLMENGRRSNLEDRFFIFVFQFVTGLAKHLIQGKNYFVGTSHLYFVQSIMLQFGYIQYRCRDCTIVKMDCGDCCAPFYMCNNDWRYINKTRIYGKWKTSHCCTEVQHYSTNLALNMLM